MSKILRWLVILAAISSSVFAYEPYLPSQNPMDIENIKNNYDLSIVCGATKELFEANGGTTITFQKQELDRKGSEETISIDAQDFCIKLGRFFLQDIDRKRHYVNFVKQRIGTSTENIRDLSFSTIMLLTNKNTRQSNLIDFTQAIIDNDDVQANKIITDDRKILYYEGKKYQTDRYGSGNAKPIN